MRRHASLSVLIMSAVVLLFLSACTEMKENRVAMAGPLTGDQAYLGKEVLDGANLAVEQWNNSGGLKGKKVELVTGDDMNQPAKAAEVAKTLCGKRPLFVVGHLDSGCSLEAAKVYKQHRVVMISPTSTIASLTMSGDDLVFRVCGRDDRQGRAAAVWLIKNRPGKTVAVVHDDSQYGRELAKEFIKNYEFLTGVNVLLNDEVKRGDDTMEQTILKCVGAKPDKIYFGGLAKQGAALLKGLRENGSSAVFMSGDGCFNEEFISTAGPEVAAGALLTFYPEVTHLPGTGGASFTKRYTERFKEPPGPFSIYGYEAVNVGLSAVSEAALPLSDRTLKDALHRLTFKTVFGLLQFDDKGDPKDSPWIMWTVENGKFKEIGI